MIYQYSGKYIKCLVSFIILNVHDTFPLLLKDHTYLGNTLFC